MVSSVLNEDTHVAYGSGLVGDHVEPAPDVAERDAGEAARFEGSCWPVAGEISASQPGKAAVMVGYWWSLQPATKHFATSRTDPGTSSAYKLAATSTYA